MRNQTRNPQIRTVSMLSKHGHALVKDLQKKAACPPLGVLWISYSLQAAIITTTNKRPLSRVLFCSASRLFQSVIRILLISSSSSLLLLPPPFSAQSHLLMLLNLIFPRFSSTPSARFSSIHSTSLFFSRPPPFTSSPPPCPCPPPSKVISDLSRGKTNLGGANRLLDAC